MTQLSENESYIYGYLNSKSSTLSFYVPRILDLDISDNEKKYYIQRVESLIEDAKALIDGLEVKKVPLNSFFNELYLLKDLGIAAVDEILKNHTYEETLQYGYMNILRAVSMRNRLDYEQKQCVEFMLKNHLIENEDLIYEYFIGNVLLKSSEISYDAFCALITDYTKLRMREFIKNPRCEILSDSEIKKIERCAFADTIYLSREDVQSLYSAGVYKVLKDMLHDLGHVKQYKSVFIDGKNDKKTLRQIKEEIICNETPGYYEDNKERISYEIEAEVFGINELIKLFDRFGITFKHNKNPYLHDLIDMVKLSSSDDRVINGHFEDLNILFEFIIMHNPSYLGVYPQLQSEYQISYNDFVTKNESVRKE